MKVNISDYEYTLSDKQIAKYPVSPRDESKLLFYHQNKIKHYSFKDIVDLLPDNAHLVLNDTKVIPARLIFQRLTGAYIEIFLLKPLEPSQVIPVIMSETQAVVWECVVGNKKKWKKNEVLTAFLDHNGKGIELTAQWLDKEKNTVKLAWSQEIPFAEVVEMFGNIPLPPYLHRKSEESDRVDYQTIYSENKGAVAAPTAGLHFTENVFKALASKGIDKSFVTLHVGAGTFMPVKEENALDHPMHSEQMIITHSLIKRLLDNADYIVPVGTTSMRSLESLYWLGIKILKGESNLSFIEKLYPYQNSTDLSVKESLSAILSYFEQNDIDNWPLNTEIMIFPSYKFKLCKALITNFHQPASTLLLLVAAFIGEEAWRQVYREAVENDYRFLSYGDSSLLIP